MPASQTKPGTRKLSDVARHVVVPTGIVTTGYPAVHQKCRDLGVEHDDWQQGLGRLILGKRDNGLYAATVGGVVLSIPRQVGKTFLIGTIIFALCLLYPNLTVLWTAHHSRTSNETFGKMQGFARRRKVRPYIDGDPRQSHGEQEIRFVNGSRILFGAREHGFGRGFDEVDIEVFDEAQILTASALEDMVAATNQSRHPAGALLFFMGTPPRPKDPGEAFTAKRTKALAGRTTDQVYVEMSGDDNANPDDRKQWTIANPSVPERTPFVAMERLRENLANDESFLLEGLGIWATARKNTVIPMDAWTNAQDEHSFAVDRFAIGVSVLPDRSMASVGFAGLREDGLWHVELHEQRAGVAWLPAHLETLVKNNPQVRALVIDGKSQAATLGEEFAARRLVPTITEAVDMGKACGAITDGLVRDLDVKHMGQPQLTYAMSVSGTRSILGGKLFGWSQKTIGADNTPWEACTLALHGAQNATVSRPTRRSGERRVALFS